MKVKELQDLLAKANPEAELAVIARWKPWDFSITLGGVGDSTQTFEQALAAAAEVHFYVDALCPEESPARG